MELLLPPLLASGCLAHFDTLLLHAEAKQGMQEKSLDLSRRPAVVVEPEGSHIAAHRFARNQSHIWG